MQGALSRRSSANQSRAHLHFCVVSQGPLVHNTGFGCPVTQAQHFDTL